MGHPTTSANGGQVAAHRFFVARVQFVSLRGSFDFAQDDIGAVRDFLFQAGHDVFEDLSGGADSVLGKGG